MSSLTKRFGFGQTKSDTEPTSPISGSSDSIGDTKLTAKASGASVTKEDELEANAQLQQIKEKHRWDPNLPEELEEGIVEATEKHDAHQEIGLVDGLLENSPYPEVRAAVRNVSS